jgi:hypothetical protein
MFRSLRIWSSADFYRVSHVLDPRISASPQHGEGGTSGRFGTIATCLAWLILTTEKPRGR